MLPKNFCSGCSACFAACGKKAITMEKDNEGFYYPKIDDKICVSCSLCKKICPEKSFNEKKEPIIYAAYAKNHDIRKSSSSGGIFSLLAKKILDENGIVIGAAMSEDFYYAKHIAVTSEDDLKLLRGSKYIQSYTGNIFETVKNALLNNKKVLFSGTPCQVVGLKSYLPETLQENLLTVDFICHGVPSPFIWEKYIKAREKEAAAKAVAVSFRKKINGWNNYSLFIEFSNGKIFSESVRENLYLRGFISDLFSRPSCYNCKIKDNAYQSDITLSDFWGAEKIFKDENIQDGVSLIIIHSEKGNDVVSLIKDTAYLKQVEKTSALSGNKSYYQSAKRNPMRKKFMKEAQKKDIDKLLKKYCSYSLISRLRRKIYKIIKNNYS